MDPDAPFSFRFIVQPLLALLLGMRDGKRDAEASLPPYGLALFTGKLERHQAAREGLRSVALPLAIAVALDMLVQGLMLSRGRIFFWHAVVVGTLLVGLPYIFSRGLTNRALTFRRHRQLRR